MFVSLPAGYGKSFCYTLLPPIYDKIRKVDRKSIVLVVSPFVMTNLKGNVYSSS